MCFCMQNSKWSCLWCTFERLLGCGDRTCLHAIIVRDDAWYEETYLILDHLAPHWERQEELDSSRRAALEQGHALLRQRIVKNKKNIDVKEDVSAVSDTELTKRLNDAIRTPAEWRAGVQEADIAAALYSVETIAAVRLEHMGSYKADVVLPLCPSAARTPACTALYNRINTVQAMVPGPVGVLQPGGGLVGNRLHWKTPERGSAAAKLRTQFMKRYTDTADNKEGMRGDDGKLLVAPAQFAEPTAEQQSALDSCAC